ncbi:hypothetical protein D3C87_125460 [compost metagenome]
MVSAYDAFVRKSLVPERFGKAEDLDADKRARHLRKYFRRDNLHKYTEELPLLLCDFKYTQEDQSTIFDLQSELQRVQGLLEEAVELIKAEQNLERDRIFEDAGCPGFDGPMTIGTKFDSFLEKVRGGNG